MIPFDAETLLRLHAHYNAAIWPGQIAAFALGLIAIWLVLKPSRNSARLVAAILAVFWLWTGIVFHIRFFAAINWTAWAYGALFVLQGLLLSWSGVLRGNMKFRVAAHTIDRIGLGFALFAATLYPMVGWSLGREWTEAAAFGVTPGPLTLFTLGILILGTPRSRPGLFVVPVVWCLIAGTTAWALNMRADLLLLIAGPVGFVLAFRKNRAQRVSS